MLIDVLFFTSRKRHAGMLEYSEKIKYKKVKTSLKKKEKKHTWNTSHRPCSYSELAGTLYTVESTNNKT